MFVGIQEITGRIFGSTSLKDKRRVIKSGITRIRNKFNLSISEVYNQDDRQMTTIAMVGVSSDKKIVEQELQQALQLLEETDGFEVVHADITFV